MARQRPRRFLAYSLLILVGLSIAAAVVVQQWFSYHLRAAQSAADRWHNADAGRHLQECERVNAEHPQVLLLMSRISRRTGNWQAAEASLEHYSTVHGNDEAWAFERLLNRAYAGGVDDTATALQSHMAEGGNKARLVRESVVNGLMAQYRYAAIQNVLGSWLDETPDDPVAVLLKGKFLEGQGGFDEAITAYRRVLELDPDLLEGRLRLAQLFVVRRAGADALVETQILRERLPGISQVRVLMAKALSLLGRLEESKRELDECLRLFPDDAEALSERGSQLLLAGDERGAVADLARAVANDPGSIPAHSQYALALARSGQQAESQGEYERVKQLKADLERTLEIVRGPLQRNPRDSNVLYELGEISARSGDTRDALRWYSKALESDPDHLPTHRALTTLYRQLDNPVLAARHRAMSQRPSSTAPKS